MTWSEVLVAALTVAIPACASDVGDDHPDAPPVSAACTEATTYSNLASLETKLFKTGCSLGGCHDGAATAAGKLDLREGHAYASLVGVPSRLEPSRTFVVAGQPTQSFLLLMIGQLQPSELAPPVAAIPTPPGIMPLNAGELGRLCAEKRDAIERWIAAGATND